VLPAAKLSKLRPGRVTRDSGLQRRHGQLEVDEKDDLAPGTDAQPRVHAAEARAALEDINMRPEPPRVNAAVPESSGTDARLALLEADPVQF
jgi:hypothetical protein